MRVMLRKSAKSKFGEADWEKISDATQFFIEENELEQYNRVVYVSFPDKIVSDVVKNICPYGNCITRFKLEYGQAVAYSFEVNVRPSYTDQVIETLFHELTHVMQELKGDIYRDIDGSEIFRGTRFSIDKLRKPSYSEYRSFPWEIEARAVASDMISRWYASRGVKRSIFMKILSFWRNL
jgi:hypothetical protein